MKLLHLVSGADGGGAKTHVLSLLSRFPERLLFSLTESDYGRLGVSDYGAGMALPESTVLYTDGRKTCMVKPFITPDTDELKEVLKHGNME